MIFVKHFLNFLKNRLKPQQIDNFTINTDRNGNLVIKNRDTESLIIIIENSIADYIHYVYHTEYNEIKLIKLSNKVACLLSHIQTNWLFINKTFIEIS